MPTGHLSRGRLLCALFALVPAFVLAGEAASAVTPSTQDHFYATRPVISGEILSVTERSLVVATDQGEQLTLALDTRTVVPADLHAGMAARTEFHMMSDGTMLAKRVVPIRSGMRRDRELAYTRVNERDAAVAMYAAAAAEGATGVPAPVAAGRQRPARMPLKAVPATHEYRLATEPAVTGRVVSVNDHRIVIDATDGELVTLAMDTRTMVPASLAPEMGVRADFKVMDNGRWYAQRIVPVEIDWPTRTTASLETAGSVAPASGRGATAVVASSEGAALAQAGTAPGTEAEVGAETRADAVTTIEGEGQAQATGEGDALPRTASAQPLVALLGLGALAAAGAVAFARRRRSG